MGTLGKRVSKRMRDVFNPSASTDELNIRDGDNELPGLIRQGRSAVRHDPISTVRRSVSRADSPEGEGQLTQEVPSSMAAENYADNEGKEDDDEEGSDEESEGEDVSPPGVSGRPAVVPALYRSMSPSVETNRARDARVNPQNLLTSLAAPIPEIQADPQTTPKASAANSPVDAIRGPPSMIRSPTPPGSSMFDTNLDKPATEKPALPVQLDSDRIVVDDSWKCWDDDWTLLSITGMETHKEQELAMVVSTMDRLTAWAARTGAWRLPGHSTGFAGSVARLLVAMKENNWAEEHISDGEFTAPFNQLAHAIVASTGNMEIKDQATTFVLNSVDPPNNFGSQGKPNPKGKEKACAHSSLDLSVSRGYDVNFPSLGAFASPGAISKPSPNLTYDPNHGSGPMFVEKDLSESSGPDSSGDTGTTDAPMAIDSPETAALKKKVEAKLNKLSKKVSPPPVMGSVSITKLPPPKRVSPIVPAKDAGPSKLRGGPGKVPARLSYADKARAKQTPAPGLSPAEAESLVSLAKLFSDQSTDQLVQMVKAGRPTGNTPAQPTPPVRRPLPTTTKGPSRKNVFIIVPPELRKGDFFSQNTVDTLNRGLVNNHSKLRVELVADQPRDGGIIAFCNNVATDKDLNTLKEWTGKALGARSDKIDAVLPQSKSALKIVGVPYMNGPRPILPMDIIDAMKSHELAELFQLECTPHISRNTTGSDSATVWFDIWDSQKGANTVRLVNHRIHICGWNTTIRKTVMHPGLAQCRCCWRWGHPTHKCRFLRFGERCAKCFGTHRTENHRTFAHCCKPNPKANPPTKGTSAAIDCLHAFRCVNCGGSHAADDVKCVYFKHRFDRPWHQRRAEEEKEDDLRALARNGRWLFSMKGT